MERALSIVNEVKAIAAQLTISERLDIIRALVAGDPRPEEELVAEQPEPERLLLDEEDAWYNLPKSERMQYAGHYVAVVNGEVIDQDLDQKTLVLRMRAQPKPTLIVWANWDTPPTLVVPSTHGGS